jgi:hypothetical protein
MPMRIFRNVDFASPSMENTIVPLASPRIDPFQAKWISFRRHSASNVISNDSREDSILTLLRTAGTVPQFRSRTAT